MDEIIESYKILRENASEFYNSLDKDNFIKNHANLKAMVTLNKL